MKKRSQHQFGGSWTNQKLDVLRGYLGAYTTALKKQNFTTAYIDAFAGTGDRTPSETPKPKRMDLFPDFKEEAQEFLDGSAALALQIEPRFNKYLFIERSPAKCEALEGLKARFPDRAGDIDIRKGDANKVIQALCSKDKDWTRHRAVLFLDPYGMQVEWKTVEAVAQTAAIDLWLLVPLGIGLNRVLTKSGNIPETWQKRLGTFLGTPKWREALYESRPQTDLFGQTDVHRVKATIERMGEFFNDRLKGIFPGVAPKPLPLMNSTNNPIYLLCFAAGNKKGAPIAVKIARHLLEGV